MTAISPDMLAKFTILVVDDEEDNLAVASMILEMAGATVYQAYNGREGLSIVQKRTIDFVICDISMPVMDGWEFVQTIRATRATVGMPVIALTAHAMPGDREKALGVGFNAYLTKPIDPEKFISQIIGLLTQFPAFRGAARHG